MSLHRSHTPSCLPYPSSQDQHRGPRCPARHRESERAATPPAAVPPSARPPTQSSAPCALAHWWNTAELGLERQYPGRASRAVVFPPWHAAPSGQSMHLATPATSSRR